MSQILVGKGLAATSGMSDPLAAALAGIDSNFGEVYPNISNLLANSRLRTRTNVVRRRLGHYLQQVLITGTLHLTMRAPAHYDAIQIQAVTRNTANTNPVTVSIAPSAKYNNGYAPVDASNNPINFTPVTWGTTDPTNPRNPGGGAANIVIPSASGSPLHNVMEGYAVSDQIQLSSLDRADTPSNPPLLMVRVYGIQPDGFNRAEYSTLSTDPFNAIEPEVFCGYWSGSDYTATSAPGSAPGQQWMPAIEVIFYLRGTRVASAGFCGDSIQQGWANANTVNSSAARANGWGRQFVALLNGVAGIPTSHCNYNGEGNYSFTYHNKAINALLSGVPGLTHLFFTAYSSNEGAGASNLPPDFARVQNLFALCRKHNVIPILVRNWAGQIPNTVEPSLRALGDNAVASGYPVLDARSLISASGNVSDNNMKLMYQTLKSDGTNSDGTPLHINAQAEADIATLAFQQRTALGFF